MRTYFLILLVTISITFALSNAESANSKVLANEKWMMEKLTQIYHKVKNSVSAKGGRSGYDDDDDDDKSGLLLTLLAAGAILLPLILGGLALLAILPFITTTLTPLATANNALLTGVNGITTLTAQGRRKRDTTGFVLSEKFLDGVKSVMDKLETFDFL